MLAEGLGTGLLTYVVVGSGIASQELTDDLALQLFAHALTVGLGLAALIAMLQAVSGAHFNPSVTLALWRIRAIGGARAIRYLLAQVLGAVVGVAAANWSFGEPAVALSSTRRDGAGLILAEGLATFVLVLVILALIRAGKTASVPAAVGAWVAAAAFATSSTGFANPAVTVARAFTDTYAGIAPASAPGFLAAQVAAGLLAAIAAVSLYPSREVEAALV